MLVLQSDCLQGKLVPLLLIVHTNCEHCQIARKRPDDNYTIVAYVQPLKGKLYIPVGKCMLTPLHLVETLRTKVPGETALDGG